MYRIGTKVVHPCYGAGTIVSIDSRQIGEIEHTYYIVDMLDSHRVTQVMVAVKRADEMGLRRVGNVSRLREIMCRCQRRPDDDQIERDYRKRQPRTLADLKSGSFGQVLDMVRRLVSLNMRRSLGYTDKARLDEGKQMLASELALAADECVDDVLQELDEQLAERPHPDGA